MGKQDFFNYFLLEVGFIDLLIDLTMYLDRFRGPNRSLTEKVEKSLNSGLF